MLGEPVRAPEAERIGLISELTEEGRADEAAQTLARRLADGPALAYAQTKALLMNGEDYAEFHAAFTEKRPPKWQGR
jgi:enoyl-CoA hydratase/carnithine racemase